MEYDGLIIRKVYPEVPTKIEYRLSDIVESLKPIIKSMEFWDNEFLKNNE